MSEKPAKNESGSVASAVREQGSLRTGIEGEASLAEARRLIGVDHRGARTSIEITADNARDYCNYIDSDNPLFRDPAYGRRSRWGRPLAPPTMVGTAIIAPGLRGVQWIYGGARWRFHRPYGPGDMIAQSGKLVGADLKHGRNAPSMIMQKGKVLCHNQHGELVVESDVFCMRIPRRRSSGGGLSYAKREVRWTRAELDGFAERVARQHERIRGAEIRYWDDLEVGTELPEILCGPLRLSEIALTRGPIVYGIIGGKENGGYGYMLDHYRRHPADSYVNPDTGVTEHPHRGHWEQYMAEEVGMPGIYDVGYQRLGWLCRFVTDWAGDDAFLHLLEGTLRKPTIVGDVTTFTGQVIEKTWRDGRAIVVCNLSGKNQNGEETVSGKAEIELVSRALSGADSAPSATATVAVRARAPAAAASIGRPAAPGLLAHERHNTEATSIAMRFWARAIGDRNPRHVSESYQPAFGGLGFVAHPCWLYSVQDTVIPSGPPGTQPIIAGTEWTFHRPVVPGDRLHTIARLLEEQTKPSRHAGSAVFQKIRVQYLDARGAEVASALSTIVRVVPEAAQRSQKYAEWKRYRYTEDELIAIERGYDAEEVRGAEPRYFESVTVGDSVAPIVRGPVSSEEIVLFVGGTHPAPGGAAFARSLAAGESVGFIHPRMGTYETFAAALIDDESARQLGFPAAHDCGIDRIAQLGSLLANWMGDAGRLLALNARLSGPNMLGDTTWFSGRVVATRSRDASAGEIEIEALGTNQCGEVTVRGSARVALPLREPGNPAAA